MKKRNFDESQEILWCDYCKEQIDIAGGVVVKRGKTYHLKCWKLVDEGMDDFGEIDGLEDQENNT